MQKKQRRAHGIVLAAYFIVILLALFFASNITLSFLYYYSAISIGTFQYLSTVATSFSFSVSAIIYLATTRKSKRSIVEMLGLARKHLTLQNLLIGVFLFLIIFLLEIVVGLISSVTGVQINTNAQLLLAGAPMWFLVFASLVAPVNEETLFRGLMVPRIGIVLSAALFAVGHFTYMSTSYVPSEAVAAVSGVVAALAILVVLFKTRSWNLALAILILALLFVTGNLGIEVIAAFVFGLLAGYIYRKTNSLYPSIVAHILVNTLTLVSTVAFII